MAFSSAKEEEVALLLDEINKPGFEQNRSQLFDLINSLTSHVPQFQKILLGKNIESSPQEVLMELDASNKMHPAFKPFLGYALEACEKLETREREGKINLQTKQRLQKKIVRFAGLILLRASSLEDQGKNIDHAQALLLQRIIDVQDPSLRYQFVSKILDNPSAVNFSQKILGFPDYAQLPMFLLFNLSGGGFSDEEMGACFRILNQRHNKVPALKDGPFQRIILKGLLTLLEDQILDLPTKSAVLKSLLLHPGSEKDHLKNAFRILKGLIDMKEQKRIKTWMTVREDPEQNPYEFLNKQFGEVFTTLISLPKDLCQAEKIADFLDRFRDSSLILRYAANLKTLPQSESNELLRLLAKGTVEQMTGCSSRYEEANNPHLKEVFKQPGLKEKWMQSQKINLTELLAPSFSSTSETLQFTNLIESSFRNDHAKAGDYPELMAFIDAKRGLEVKTKEKERDFETILKPKEDQKKMLEFQDALIELCKTPSVDSLNKALAYCPDEVKAQSPVFYQDLQAWKQSLEKLNSKATSSEESLVAVECDNFFDLMACGTEVAGSCQNVDGTASLNKCLLAYVMDGKNRLLALTDEQGVIKARAILRVLIDATTNKPVLFMEKIYPTIVKPEWKEGLIALAKLKARSTGLPLLSQEVSGGKRYPHPIKSLSSPAPFEYVDADSGIKPEGKFTIQEAFEHTL